MNEDVIAEEAVDWLLWRLDESPDKREFWRWLLTSPTHLRVFWEFMELEQRFKKSTFTKAPE